MKEYKFYIIVLAILIAIIPVSVALSAGGSYELSVSVNNTGAAITNGIGDFTQDTDELIDLGYLNSSATDADMQDPEGTSIAFAPSVNNTYPWVFAIPSQAAETEAFYNIYMGGATGGLLRYFPASGGMVIHDDNSMETTNFDNWTIEINGRFNGEDGNLWIKEDSEELSVSSGNLSATVYYETRELIKDTLIDNGYLYMAGDDLFIQRINLSTLARESEWFNIQDHMGDSFATGPGNGFEGIVSDGTYIYAYYNGQGTGEEGIVKIQISNATVTDSITETVGSFEYCRDMLVDSGNLFLATEDGDNNDIIYKIDTSDMSIADNFTSDNHSDYRHLAFYGSQLYVGCHSDIGGSATAVMRINDDTMSFVDEYTDPDDGGYPDTMTMDSNGFVYIYNYYSPIRKINSGDWSITDNLTLADIDPEPQKMWMQGTDLYITLDDPNASPYSVAVLVSSMVESNTFTTTSNEACSAVIHDGTNLFISETGSNFPYTTYMLNTPAMSENTTIETAVHSTSLTASLSEGEHKIELLYDTVGSDELIVEIDDVEEDNQQPMGYPYSYRKNVDNSANITAVSSDAMDYVESVKRYVDDTLVGSWAWEYDDTEFSDLSGNGNIAYPTFRTASDITGTFESFTSDNNSEAPSWVIENPTGFYTDDTDNVTDNATSGNVSGSTPPGSVIIDEGAAAAGVVNIWLWGLLAMIILVMTGLILSTWERHYGSGGGTLIVRILVHIIVFGILIAWGKFDWWMLILYLFIALAFAEMSRHPDIGGNATTHGIIGFLAASWVGLTIINRILEGQFVTSYENTWANYFAVTQELVITDTFRIPVINFDFFTYGIPALVKWDYSFFGGNAQMFQYLLYSLTAVVGFIVFPIIIGILFNTLRTR